MACRAEQKELTRWPVAPIAFPRRSNASSTTSRPSAVHRGGTTRARGCAAGREQLSITQMRLAKALSVSLIQKCERGVVGFSLAASLLL
jgi:hypothetical protein